MEYEIPDWDEQEKDTFIVIARRRKDEVALGFAVVGVGAQLFEHISKHRTSKIENGAIDVVETHKQTAN